MEAKEFGNELKRMFKSLGGEPNERCLCDGVECSECPFNVVRQEYTVCTLYSGRIDEVIDIVTAWSKENPKETNRDAFLKAFPNARLCSNGFPTFGVCRLGLVDKDPKTCDGNCAVCWNGEYINREYEV